MEETDLITGLLNRNSASINYFVHLYQQFIYAVSYRMIEQHEAAEELTQDVLVKCIEKIDQFNRQSSLKTWVYRITHNETINQLRKENRRIPTINDEFVPDSTDSVSLDSEIDRAEMTGLIQKYLSKLPVDQKEILVLFYLKELNLKEICDALDLSMSNAKVRLYRARENFGKGLKTQDLQLLNEMRYG